MFGVIKCYVFSWQSSLNPCQGRGRQTFVKYIEPCISHDRTVDLAVSLTYWLLRKKANYPLYGRY